MFKRGKLPARPDAVKLKFGAYFSASNLPAVPAVFGRPWMVRQWGVLANDVFGDCVWAGAAHETMLLRADAGYPAPPFMNSNVLADYSAVTGFDKSKPETDQGTDLQVAAAYRQKTGIMDAAGTRHTIDIYTALHVGDLSQIALAAYLFGAVGIGVNLPSSAEDQFNAAEPWHVVPGDTLTGGHYIPLVGRNSRGDFLVVTWGRLQAVEAAWLQANMDEGIAYVSPDRLNAQGVSPENYSAAQLADDYKQVTA